MSKWLKVTLIIVGFILVAATFLYIIERWLGDGVMIIAGVILPMIMLMINKFKDERKNITKDNKNA